MSATITSLIRTWVPVAVGTLVSWLLTLGVTLDDESQAGLTVALTGLLIAGYYTIVRLLEKRWPFLGVLLGSASAPVYGDMTPTADVVALVGADGHLTAGDASTIETGTQVDLAAPIRDLVTPVI